MEIYQIRCRENGDVIDTFDTKDEAYDALDVYETQDQADGIYEEDFYEVTTITFAVGDECLWHDPAILDYEDPKAALKRVWVIEYIEEHTATAWIYEREVGGPAQTQVYLHELELIN